MNANSFNPPSSSPSAYIFKTRLQFRYRQDQHFALVMNYLQRRGYTLPDVLKELFKARFTAAALNEEGKLDQATALECIGKLKGYIYEIEQLAGLAPSFDKAESNSHSQSSRAAEPDVAELDIEELDAETEKAESPRSSAVDMDEIDRMLGFSPLSPFS